MNPNSYDGVIRITKEEATSDHVEDLLKRQMSLRGEPGVTRDHGRVWYYQNWFVFMLVGMTAALLSWAIIEPFFDDLQYFQGPISALDASARLPARMVKGDREVQLHEISQGSLTIKGETIHLAIRAKEIKADGSKDKLDLSSLKVGDTVGVYVHCENVMGDQLALGSFLVRSPPAQSPARAKMSLEHLHARTSAAGFLMFALVAGMMGLFLGSADGLICRLPRRALLCGAVGLLVGTVGGFVSNILAEIAYAPLNMLAMKQGNETDLGLSTFGFVIQLFGRSLAWALAGLAMGLGQGIALRSKRLLLYGLLGGVLGGLLGGLLFDPIDLILLGPDKPSAHWSRLIGFAVIGASVGGMIGVVELLARDAWLRMTQGPLVGKEFLLFKDVMNVGCSPRSDIYLFNDTLVGENHAVLRAVGDECEIEACDRTRPVLLNNRAVQKARLRHGDNVTVGRTVFVFQRRKG